jgi:hypothetical protein
MPVDRTRLKVRAFERKWKRKGEDLCDVISTSPSVDEYGGSGTTPTTLASALPCFYEPLSQREQSIAGGEMGILTHRITLKATTTTLAIKPSYQIRVAARGDKPQYVFENPTPEIGSFSPLVEVTASMRTL